MKEDEPNINVFNRQRKLPVDTQAVRNFLRQVAERLGVDRGFSVVLLSDRAMRHYHARFAGQNWPTDVLSFPAQSFPAGDTESDLGDILVSVETAHRQKQSTLTRELQILSLHGLLHLLGFDHETDQGEMEAVERQLREDFRLESGHFREPRP